MVIKLVGLQDELCNMVHLLRKTGADIVSVSDFYPMRGSDFVKRLYIHLNVKDVKM